MPSKITESEAIKEVRFNMSTIGLSDEASKRVVEARDMAINALEKQMPKKMNKEILSSNAFTQWRKYNCPICGCFLYSGSYLPFSTQPYCYQCGQKLDWSDEE